MKIKILILSVLCLLFSHCKSDDNTIENKNPLVKKLVKKVSIKTTGKYENDFSYFDFSYKNGEVSEIIKNGNEKSVFEYNGNKLIKLSNYNADNLLLSYIICSYEKDKFSSQLYKNGEAQDKFDFFLNENQEVYKIIYMDYDVYNYTYSNGNISSEIINDEKNLISFDNNFNPFTNHNIYFRIIYNDYLYHTLSKNNPIKIETFENKNSEFSSIKLFDIVYDSDNYPIKVTEKDDTETTEYNFEYIKNNFL